MAEKKAKKKLSTFLLLVDVQMDDVHINIHVLDAKIYPTVETTVCYYVMVI